jgi:ribosome assembly protein SQT1
MPSPEDHPDSEPEMLPEDDALEEIEDEGDVAMDSDEDEEELTLQNDSVAYFDAHKDSVFAIAQHPLRPTLIATGGSEGEGDDAPGKGYVVDTSAAAERPVLPSSYSADPTAPRTSTQLESVFTIDGHTDSINGLAFTLPRGDILVSGGMDGRIRAYSVTLPANGAPAFKFIGEAQEVPEVNWVSACPSTEYPNTIALGASDGSVWVYTIDAADTSNPLQIVQSYFLHTGSCTAGAWTPDGTLLATVSEDSSLYVWDVWGLAAAKGLVGDNGMTAVSLTAADQRFEVEGGLYSVAIDPKGAFVATGGAGGAIKIVSLPRIASAPQPKQKGKSQGKSASDPTAGGQILASLHTQTDGIETLTFVSPAGPAATQAQGAPLLLAAGSVDGSIAIYDAGRRFAVRRHIVGAHEEFSVVKLDFVKGTWLLTSCGMDGVVRRWDLRGGTAGAKSSTAAEAGLVKEWKGHRGDGEGGGVLGFVQGETGERIITAGDDGVVLVFEA